MDYNGPLNPVLDSSSGSSSLPFKALRQIKFELQKLTLHDAWRTLSPSTQDYTFFLTQFQKYARIDYFFLSQTDLSCLQYSTIEPMFLSNHHPIIITLFFPETCTETKSWRLNPSLLKDPVTIDRLRTHIRQYFAENDSSEVSPVSLWEAHK